MESPFPLQENLKELKPNPTRALSPLVLGLAVFWEPAQKWLKGADLSTEVLVGAGLAVAVLLFFVADLYIRQVFYNTSGVGVARRFGGEAQWYPFDELREVKGSLKRGSGRGRRGVGRVSLVFHSGTVRLWPGLYQEKQVAELFGLLQGRSTAPVTGEGELGTPEVGRRKGAKPQKAANPAQKDPWWKRIGGTG